MGQKKRISYLDMAKGVGVVLMVTGHVISYMQTHDYKAYLGPIYHWIASFHMPLFFIISGILLWITGEEKKDMKQIVLRKVKTLLLPYIVFSIIYILINLHTSITHPEVLPRSEILKYVIHSITFRGIGVLWFLTVLFIGEVFFLFCRKHLSDIKLAGLFSILGLIVLSTCTLFQWESWENSYALMVLGALLQTIYKGILAGFFLMIGYFSAGLLQKNERKTIREFMLGVILIIAEVWLCFQNSQVDMNYMVFDNIWLYILCSCMGSYGIILICKNVYQSRFLRLCGANSLVIMVTHIEFRVLMQAIMFAYWLMNFVTRAREYVLFFAMAVMISILEAFIIFIFNHYLYFLIGKRKPEKMFWKK